jgi:hypothetical protein
MWKMTHFNSLLNIRELRRYRFMYRMNYRRDYSNIDKIYEKHERNKAKLRIDRFIRSNDFKNMLEKGRLKYDVSKNLF